jgi:putative MFS transporter
LSLQQFTTVIAAGFLGMFTGTIVFGMGSDRMGRRSAFVTMLLIYSMFTLAGAFAPSAGWLVVLRFFAGIGIGAELVVIDTYVSEMVPSSARGRYVAITQTVGFSAVPVAAILVRLLVPTHFLMDGWRWVMVIGSLGFALAWYFRRSLPESPRWLESRGRHAEAEQALALLAAEIARPRSRSARGLGDDSFQHINSTHHMHACISENAERASFVQLWRSPYRRRTIQAGDLSRLADHRVLRVRELGTYFSAAPRRFSAALVGVHAADRPRVPARNQRSPFSLRTSLERKWNHPSPWHCSSPRAAWAFALWTLPTLIVLSGALVTLCSNCFPRCCTPTSPNSFQRACAATVSASRYSWSRLSASFSSLLIGAVLVRAGVGRGLSPCWLLRC